MQIETVGNYQLHLTAIELPGPVGWDPYVAIFKFDESVQDFRCVLEKHHASNKALSSYDEAMNQARRVGNSFIEKEGFDKL